MKKPVWKHDAPRRLFTVNDIISETGDRELLTVATSRGVTVRGHWYEDHMLTALNMGTYYRKRGEGFYEEIII